MVTKLIFDTMQKRKRDLLTSLVLNVHLKSVIRLIVYLLQEQLNLQ